ncbi:hypothetical protein Tph_c02840 [Thermacetogenium phaeum DSM 12270]|uniref:Uncharacterized protein n=1 Tax=Thermacetogenium phaeum (strain ATCC BAA-254 / DSM 26808 / PB) TaxID=1089553 RepID=K4LC71_THEPS|nr:hypothetical protein [Thermacetogenium phaeum]AFV10531.1 hypothetical protein Tph_c02840 [Thermacetogenium phaeum DSM 12270]
MRVHSLYKFYQAHFGYPRASTDRQGLAFALAVKDCINVLQEIYQRNNLQPISEYQDSLYARRLTLCFLKNLKDLAASRFQDPLRSLRYLDYEIEVSPQLLQLGRKSGLFISSPLLWYHQQSELIFLTFGASGNMTAELGVFRTLSEQLSIQKLSVSPVELYTYWNLIDGEATTCVRRKIQPAPVDRIIHTCNQVLNAK